MCNSFLLKYCSLCARFIGGEAASLYIGAYGPWWREGGLQHTLPLTWLTNSIFVFVILFQIKFPTNGNSELSLAFLQRKKAASLTYSTCTLQQDKEVNERGAIGQELSCTVQEVYFDEMSQII